MNEEQKKAFIEQLALLPISLQQAVFESDWEEKVIAIGHKTKLYYDQIDELLSETALVLTGLVAAEEFEDRLIDTLMLDDLNKARELVRQINLEIFNNIQESMKQETSAEKNQFTKNQPAPLTQETEVPNVFKINPEKHVLKNIDPYHEPID